MTDRTDWRAALLADGGLFSEKEPELDELEEDEALRDEWEGLRAHLFRFHADGTFLYFYEDESNHGRRSDLREGTFAVEGDRLRLTFLARYERSSSDWVEPPVRASRRAVREEHVLALGEDGAVFDFDGAPFHPAVECAGAEGWREDLDVHVNRVRSASGEATRANDAE